MDSDKIIYTGGTFDLFHYGHVNFLRQCASLGKVTVSLNPDEFIQEFKGKAPVMTFAEREKSLRGCKYVSNVVPNIGGQDSRPAILCVHPNIIAIGSDWARKDYYSQMGFTQDWLDKQGISLIYIPYTEDISTTDIKKRVKDY